MKFTFVFLLLLAGCGNPLEKPQTPPWMHDSVSECDKRITLRAGEEPGLVDACYRGWCMQFAEGNPIEHQCAALTKILGAGEAQ